MEKPGTTSVNLPCQYSLCSTGLLLWQRSGPQIWFDDLEIREQRLGFVVLDCRMYDHVVARNPVDRRGNSVLVAGLERIDYTKNLCSVASS